MSGSYRCVVITDTACCGYGTVHKKIRFLVYKRYHVSPLGGIYPAPTWSDVVIFSVPHPLPHPVSFAPTLLIGDGGYAGIRKFRFKTCANVFSSAAVADTGMIFIGCNTETGPVSSTGVGSLYAVNPSKRVTIG